MNFDEKLQDVQSSLSQQKLDGWLFYDFRRMNPLACQFLDIHAEKLLTRRFFYWIPAHGEPVKIVHTIEDQALSHLPGATWRYHTWKELETHVESVLKGSKRIAMEYSPRNAIPYVSKVDAGTMDVIRGFGVEVVSSADLLQKYTSVWDEDKLRSHLAAAEVLCSGVDKAWKYIAISLAENRSVSEYDVQQFILEHFKLNGCMTADHPICAVNAHSADPHYSPNKSHSSLIKHGDFILMIYGANRMYLMPFMPISHV